MYTNLETCLERIKKRGGVKNKFDNSSKMFYEKVINGYSNIVKERGDNVIQVDGNDEIEKVFSKILESVPELGRFKTEHDRLGGYLNTINKISSSILKNKPPAILVISSATVNNCRYSHFARENILVYGR